MREWMVAATLALAQALTPALAQAGDTLPQGLVFGNIDGGTIALDDWRGHPMLIVNTASMCGFADQFTQLQALYDAHRAEGLVVLAVPSDDFSQELATEGEVRDYCEVTYGIDLPMTVITVVTGPDAHPLYLWLAQDQGFAPGWNFNKVLIGGDGRVLDTWGAMARPDGGRIAGAVAAALASG